MRDYTTQYMKCLYNYDNCYQIIDREKRVAFIGISNWALDPAKMNRGVMVTRGKPDEEELILSAKFVIVLTNFSYVEVP